MGTLRLSKWLKNTWELCRWLYNYFKKPCVFWPWLAPLITLPRALAPVTQSFYQLLEHFKFVPALGPLHELFLPIPLIFFWLLLTHHAFFKNSLPQSSYLKAVSSSLMPSLPCLPCPPPIPFNRSPLCMPGTALGAEIHRWMKKTKVSALVKLTSC